MSIPKENFILVRFIPMDNFNLCMVGYDGLIPETNFVYGAVMDVFEIRKENLRYLIQREYKTVAKFSRASGIDDSYLRRVLYDADNKWVKRIGDDLVQKILTSTGKPPGWLDVPQWESAESNESVMLPIDNHRLGTILRGFNNNQQGEGAKMPIGVITRMFHVDSHHVVMAVERQLNLYKTENKAETLKEAITFLELAVSEYENVNKSITKTEDTETSI